MSRKSGIVRSVQPCRSARRNQHGFCFYVVGDFFIHAKAVRTDHARFSVFSHGCKVSDVQMIYDFDIFLSRRAFCQQWLDICAIDFDISPASAHIVSIFVFENDKPAFF